VIVEIDTHVLTIIYAAQRQYAHYKLYPHLIRLAITDGLPTYVLHIIIIIFSITSIEYDDKTHVTYYTI